MVLLTLGVIVIIIGFEDPGQSDKGQPFGGLFAMFGVFQFNFPEQFVVLVGIGVVLMNLAGALSLIALIASIVAMWDPGRRTFPIVVLLASLPMVALFVFYWLAMVMQ